MCAEPSSHTRSASRASETASSACTTASSQEPMRHSATAR